MPESDTTFLKKKNPKITCWSNTYRQQHYSEIYLLNFSPDVDLIRAALYPTQTHNLTPFSDLSSGVPAYFNVSLSIQPYHPSQLLALFLYLLSYLLRLLLFISSSLILTPAYHSCRHVLCLSSCCNGSITVQHLPQTSKPPSDTSTSQSWHSTLTSPAKTWQPSTYPGGWIYETIVWTKLGSPR